MRDSYKQFSGCLCSLFFLPHHQFQPKPQAPHRCLITRYREVARSRGRVQPHFLPSGPSLAAAVLIRCPRESIKTFVLFVPRHPQEDFFFFKAGPSYH